MSYGVNAPWGLRPMMKQGASTFDMTETYPIASGQTGNIFTGDLVYLDTSGYVFAFSPNVNALNNTNLALGVFVGCNYTAPASANPTNMFQMNPMWTSNTVTATGADAVAYVITDPTVMFNIQANNTGALVGSGAGSIIGSVSTIDNTIAGNASTGQSGMRLNADPAGSITTIGAFGTATGVALLANQYPLKVRGVVQVPNNVLTTPTTTGIPYVNLIVSLNNTVYQTGQVAA